MSHTILLVEDEPSLALTLEDRLRAEGYCVESAADGETGFERGLVGDLDLIVLDLNLPKKGGLDVCRDLRARGVATPILMLTARGDVVDRVVGLKMGADDYLAKPFETVELLARIEALLRRPAVLDGVASKAQGFADVRVDLDAAEVTKAGEPVELSALELRLLAYFLEHRVAACCRATNCSTRSGATTRRR